MAIFLSFANSISKCCKISRIVNLLVLGRVEPLRDNIGVIGKHRWPNLSRAKWRQQKDELYKMKVKSFFGSIYHRSTRTPTCSQSTPSWWTTRKWKRRISCTRGGAGSRWLRSSRGGWRRRRRRRRRKRSQRERVIDPTWNKVLLLFSFVVFQLLGAFLLFRSKWRSM